MPSLFAKVIDAVTDPLQRRIDFKKRIVFGVEVRPQAVSGGLILCWICWKSGSTLRAEKAVSQLREHAMVPGPLRRRLFCAARVGRGRIGPG